MEEREEGGEGYDRYQMLLNTISLRSRMSAAIAGSAIVAVLTACESNQSTTKDQTLPTPSGSTRWVSHPAAEGLDIRWVVIEGGHSLAPSLAAIENIAVPADPEAIALWRSVGLRVAAIPAQHVHLLTEHTGRPRAREQRWLPNPTTWHELTRGPASTTGLVLSLDQGRIRMPPGRPRLLVRAWTRPIADPDTGPRSAMRLELVPQHETRSTRDDGSLTPSPALTLLDAESHGMVFRRFQLSIDAEPGMAYVVYAESPDVDWPAIARGEALLSGVSWFERLPEPVEDEQQDQADEADTMFDPVGGPFGGDHTTDTGGLGTHPDAGVFALPPGPGLGDDGTPGSEETTGLGQRRGRMSPEGTVGPAGPKAPKTPYLGEVLLTQRPPSFTRDGARVMVIILPIFDPTYRLIGD